MANHFNLPHWNYFRALEQELEQSFRYVSLSEAHFQVHSDEFGKLILVASCEIENSLRELANFIKPASNPKNIDDLREIVLGKFEWFHHTQVEASRYNLTIRPWEEWACGNNPDWWKHGYNKIKHDREGNPQAATLHRAIASVAALEVVLLHLYRHKFKVDTLPISAGPHLFEIVPEPGGMQDAFFGWSWELPDDESAKQKRRGSGSRESGSRLVLPHSQQ